LAEARRFHLTAAWFFALGTATFAIWSFLSGHAKRSLFVRLRELSPSNLFREIKAHMLPFRKSHSDHLTYNTLQKLSYLSVTGLIIPTLILTGLTMSPWINAVVPWLLDIFGGRQSARSIHFICAVAVSLFVVIHLIMVLLSGPFNQIRAMITGRYALPKKDEE
jgi:thiosulfate reductase cytochrome b subunit